MRVNIIELVSVFIFYDWYLVSDYTYHYYY